MNFRFLPSLGMLSVLIITTFYGKITFAATTTYAECTISAAKLGLEPRLCSGQSTVSNASVRKVTDADTLRSLGIALRRLGFLDQAQNALDRVLEIKPDSEKAHLSMANIIQAKYRRSLASMDFSTGSIPNLEESDKAIKLGDRALSEYLAILKINPKQLEAKLNWLNLWSNLKGTTELKHLQNQNLDTAKSIISQLNTQLSNASDAEAIDSRLKLSEFLLRANSLDNNFLTTARENLNESIKNSYKLNNLRLISEAEGLSGRLEILDGDNNKAIQSFLKAYSEAESIRAYDSSYKWAREIGRIYATRGDYQKGIDFYSDAIDRIENVRTKMTNLKPDIQYSFRDEIEPIYKEYLALLFKNPKPNLSKVVEVNEKLQVGELEDYLQCSQLDLESLLSLKPDKSPDSTLYFVQLPNLYAILDRNKSGQLHYHFVNKSRVDGLLVRMGLYAQGEAFLESTDSIKFREVISQLYDLLIRPIEKDLPPSGHLTLAVDSGLQSLPWSLLYDGQQYLIEKYSLSLALGTKLQSPNPMSNGKISALLAGSSQFPKNPEFLSLPSVPREINAIRTELKGKTLLDKDFTSAALLNNATSVDILHLASHGQFSSNPENTFLLDWNGKFQLSQLESLIKNREKPLDLLVLSACDTAKGDRRALLGLAGTAIQSGARSTVASLWLVNDDSQAILMQEFYKQLIKKTPKAEALRLAQIKLLKSGQYSSPFYWAGMVLLGSWL